MLNIIACVRFKDFELEIDENTKRASRNCCRNSVIGHATFFSQSMR
jgi:hypothetical protein